MVGIVPEKTRSRRIRDNSALRFLGTGIITGAADDDPSAIGTYASAGARYGLGFLWIAPCLLPMMYVVTYVSAKLGLIYGKGLFAAIRDRFPRWVLMPTVFGAFLGNVVEAAADLGGIGLPPEKWSSLMYGLRHGGGFQNAQEAPQGGGDRRQVTAGRCFGLTRQSGR